MSSMLALLEAIEADLYTDHISTRQRMTLDEQHALWVRIRGVLNAARTNPTPAPGAEGETR